MTRACHRAAVAGALWLLLFGCAPSRTPVREPVSPTLARSTNTALELADALEALVATGKATEAERQYAYQRATSMPAVTAEDTLARAMIAGRLAQVSGLAAPTLVKEVERYARSSAELDPSLRAGAARRLLGTLYVMAPASLVEHGDSEVGLELLQGVVRSFPNHPANQLRLAEGYVALGDREPARPHLCFCRTHRGALRPDEQALLGELLEQAQVTSCP